MSLWWEYLFVRKCYVLLRFQQDIDCIRRVAVSLLGCQQCKIITIDRHRKFCCQWLKKHWQCTGIQLISIGTIPSSVWRNSWNDNDAGIDDDADDDMWLFEKKVLPLNKYIDEKLQEKEECDHQLQAGKTLSCDISLLLKPASLFFCISESAKTSFRKKLFTIVVTVAETARGNVKVVVYYKKMTRMAERSWLKAVDDQSFHASVPMTCVVIPFYMSVFLPRAANFLPNHLQVFILLLTMFCQSWTFARQNLVCLVKLSHYRDTTLEGYITDRKCFSLNKRRYGYSRRQVCKLGWMVKQIRNVFSSLPQIIFFIKYFETWFDSQLHVPTKKYEPK